MPKEMTRLPFLWLTVHYDHQFYAVSPNRTRLTWVVDAEGFGAPVFGRLFAAVYSRNLDKAIPILVASIGHLNKVEPTVGTLIFFEDTEGNVIGAMQYDSDYGK